MIAAWMLYSLLVGGLVYAAASAAEFVCRASTLPTRFVWAAALCLTLGLSANGFRRSLEQPTARPTPAVTITTSVGSAPPATTDARAKAPSERAAALVTRPRAPIDLSSRLLDASGIGELSRFDRPLAIAALTTALAAIAHLLFALARMRRVADGLEPHDVDGHRVLLSDELGPALVGIARPRVVLPRWVLTLSDAERRTILAHERQHARAGDPALAAGTALVVALLPWNVAMWGLCARLRLAIEADCDARVIRSNVDARRYGALLLTVYERTMNGRAPRLAFVERRSHLEERVRRLARRAPSLRSTRGVAGVLGTIVLGALACETTAPSKAARDSATRQVTTVSPPSASVVGVEPRCLRAPSTVLALRDSGGARHLPTMAEMMAAVRPYRTDVFQPRDKHLVLGILLDENCRLLRDTVVDYPPTHTDNSLVALTFGDTMGFAPYRGLAFFPDPKYGGPVTVLFAVRPSEPWRERVARNECGFGIRFSEHCFMQGALELRMLDSVRALIAVRRFRAPNQPADHLFLVTLARPYHALKSLSMAHAIVSFQSGAVYVEDFGATQPLWLFAPSTSDGLPGYKYKRDVTVFSDLVGSAHYNAGWLTLEQVRELTPSKSCDGPKGACYEVNGRRIEFPG